MELQRRKPEFTTPNAKGKNGAKICPNLFEHVPVDQFEWKKFEKFCTDLLDRLEQLSAEIECSKVELQTAATSQGLANQTIWKQRAEIKRLKESEVADCIICNFEFGEDGDRQRAHWKNCNHANICYKCTKTLWSKNQKHCPSCKTLATSMPTRLPPKLYLWLVFNAMPWFLVLDE
ncbi:unnamed protein product [Calypogeia fissa]